MASKITAHSSNMMEASNIVEVRVPERDQESDGSEDVSSHNSVDSIGSKDSKEN